VADYSTCDPATSGCYDGLRPVDPDFEYDPKADDQAAELKRELAAKAMFPCPIHDPDRFLRWRAGDWPHPNAVVRLGATVDGEVTIRTAAAVAEQLTIGSE